MIKVHTLVRPSAWPRYAVVGLLAMTLATVMVARTSAQSGSATHVTTDAPVYTPGQRIVATAFNDGPGRTTSSVGYPCGAIRIEQAMSDGSWVELPSPPQPCILLARILNPGESFSQDNVPAPAAEGLYRLTYHYGDDATGEPGSAASVPFSVIQ